MHGGKASRCAALLCVFLLGLSLRPAVAAAAAEGDPIEPVNRGIFWFNDKLDVWVLEPVAKGWDFVLPQRVQQSVTNFFDNLRSPVVLVNDVLQAKPRRAAITLTRFALNTVVGIGGLFDAAAPLGLDGHDEDFGQTLGYWGVPPGPYLMLPILGPSNPRDGVGMIADSFAAVYPFFVGVVYTIGPRVVSVVNQRAQVLDEVRDAKEASVDYYVFVRNAYVQHRREQVRDGQGMTEEEEEDLYYFDEE